MKKYELTSVKKVIHGVPVRRICALYGFSASNGRTVKPGDMGGWVQSERNLSQFGNAWIFDDAAVFDDGYVYDYACIEGSAEVSEHGRVSGYAQVSGNALVERMAHVCGRAVVCGNASIRDHAMVCGNAVVSGSAGIYGRPCIDLHADISGNSDYVHAGPIGSSGDFVTFFRDSKEGIGVACGCFRGSLELFRDKVKRTHGDSQHADPYLLAALMAEMSILGK